MSTAASASSSDNAEQKFNFKIHDTIRTLQNENGLRHQDHMRYRHYLSRKLRRIRKTVGFMYGKGKTYVKKEISPETVTSTTYLLIPLLLAERAWSYAAELKDAFAKVGKKTIRQSELGKFAKAAKWAKLLESLCLEKGDTQTVLEASAYSSWMNGQSMLEKESWPEAVSALSTAKAIYDELSKLGTLDQQDLFTQKVVEIEPSLRFCRYNVSGSGANNEIDVETLYSNPDLLAKLEEMKLKNKSSIDTSHASAALGFQWGSKPVILSSESLLTSMTKVKSALDALGGIPHSTLATDMNLESGSLGKLRDQVYARVLTAIDDTRGLVSTSLSELAVGGGGKLGEMKSEYQHLKSYLSYERLAILLQRNNELIAAIDSSTTGTSSHSDSKKTHHDLAHLYDKQLTTVREILTIQGCEEDDMLALRLAAQEQLYRAYRVYYIAECYAEERKWAESIALLDLASDAIVNAVYNRIEIFSEALQSGEVQTEDRALLSSLSLSLTALENYLCTARMRFTALGVLEQQQQLELQTNDSGAGTVSDQEVQAQGAAATAPLASAAAAAGESAGRMAGSLLTRRGDWITPRSRDSKLTDASPTSPTKAKVRRNRREVDFGAVIVYDIPPAFAPIPCKPVFFDIAFNHIDFPDIDERAGLVSAKKAAGSAAASTSKETTGGIVGAAQNLFGWFRTAT